MRSTKNQRRMEKIGKATEHLRHLHTELVLSVTPLSRAEIVGLQAEFAELQYTVNALREVLDAEERRNGAC